MIDCRAVRSLSASLLLSGCVATLAVAIGCDRAKPTASSAPSNVAVATSAPAIDVLPEPSPTTTTAGNSKSIPTTWPSVAFVRVGQQSYEFPAAKLRLAHDDGKVSALLCSDDPKEAIDEKYTGNSFYIEMDLDISDPTEIASAGWHFTTSSNERADTPNGIFLQGHRHQLQPLDVGVSFQAVQDNANLTTVTVGGKFLWIDTQDVTSAPREVGIFAHLIAQTSVKSK